VARPLRLEIAYRNRRIRFIFVAILAIFRNRSQPTQVRAISTMCDRSGIWLIRAMHSSRFGYGPAVTAPSLSTAYQATFKPRILDWVSSTYRGKSRERRKAEPEGATGAGDAPVSTQLFMAPLRIL
jgi:hypothetical protein